MALNCLERASSWRRNGLQKIVHMAVPSCHPMSRWPDLLWLGLVADETVPKKGFGSVEGCIVAL